MRRTIAAKQITEEFWLATLALTEPGKVPQVRDFIVSEPQLAFLNAFCKENSLGEFNGTMSFGTLPPGTGDAK